MNRHDLLHEPKTSTMYDRGRLVDFVWQSSLEFFALRTGEEAVAFMRSGENYLCPLPEPWEIVYQPTKGNQ